LIRCESRLRIIDDRRKPKLEEVKSLTEQLVLVKTKKTAEGKRRKEWIRMKIGSGSRAVKGTTQSRPEHEPARFPLDSASETSEQASIPDTLIEGDSGTGTSTNDGARDGSLVFSDRVLQLRKHLDWIIQLKRDQEARLQTGRPQRQYQTRAPGA